jgi:hypothetical protein
LLYLPDKRQLILCVNKSCLLACDRIIRERQLDYLFGVGSEALYMYSGRKLHTVKDSIEKGFLAFRADRFFPEHPDMISFVAAEFQARFDVKRFATILDFAGNSFRLKQKVGEDIAVIAMVQDYLAVDVDVKHSKWASAIFVGCWNSKFFAAVY